MLLATVFMVHVCTSRVGVSVTLHLAQSSLSPLSSLKAHIFTARTSFRVWLSNSLSH